MQITTIWIDLPALWPSFGRASLTSGSYTILQQVCMEPSMDSYLDTMLAEVHHC
jgi:hypothetical protein